MAQLSITSLGLRSLKEISDGDVIISKNQNLCYTNKNHWQRLFISNSQIAIVDNNLDAATCGASHFRFPTMSSVRNLLLFQNPNLIKQGLDNYVRRISCWESMFVFSPEEQYLWQEVYCGGLLGPRPGHVFRLQWLQPWWELCWLLQHPRGVRKEFRV